MSSLETESSSPDVRQRKRVIDMVLESLAAAPEPLHRDLEKARRVYLRAQSRWIESERRLCERLHVPSDLDERDRWALIGSRLAAGQKEFRRGRGQPKKSVSSGELLAADVDGIKSMPGGGGLSDLQAVELMMAFYKDCGQPPKGDPRHGYIPVEPASRGKKISTGRARARAKRLPE